MAATANATVESRLSEGALGWPRWASAVLTASGLIVIVAETTSVLFFAGLLLAALGIYGFVARSRARRAVRRLNLQPTG
jgi:NADH:ubiquinone oxidoreductase subunit 2 (subunit N)